MILSCLLTIGLLAALTWYLWNGSRKPNNFPPGPTRFPILGSIPFLMTKPRDKEGNVIKINPLLNLLEKFGDVVGFYIGRDPAVIIKDYKMVATLLKMDQTTGRTPVYPMNETRPGWEALNGTENEGRPPGVIYTDGKLWKEHRRFLLKNLKDLGFGKSSMESSILEEAQKLIEEVNTYGGKPIRLIEKMNIAVLNSLWFLLVGEKLNFHDEKALKVAEIFHNLVKESPSPRPPICHFLPSYSMLKWKILEPFTKRSTFAATFDGINSILSPILEYHLEEYDPANIKDLMGLMIKESKETLDSQSSFYGDVGMKIMINDLMELFMAGMETTSSSLLWACLYMLHHPDVKRRVQDELDRVFGDDEPSLRLKPACHYTNAVLLESLRLSAVLPFSVPHRATEPITFGKYAIPKGTMIIPSLVSIMRDPHYFKDATKFKPERFIDENGEFKSDKRIIPFSIGKRICPGQSLAEKEYFLFFAMMMKKLDMNQVPLEELPSPELGDMKAENFIRAVPNFEMIMTKR